MLVSMAILHSSGRAQSLPTANIERTSIRRDAEGIPTELVIELGVKAEFVVDSATLLFRSLPATEDFQEVSLKRDLTLRYIAVVPFTKAFEYSVRLTPERGADVVTEAAVYELPAAIIEDTGKKNWLKAIVWGVVIVAGTIFGIGRVRAN